MKVNEKLKPGVMFVISHAAKIRAHLKREPKPILSGISAHVHHICSHVHLNLCRESQLCAPPLVNPLATVCLSKQVCCV